MDFNFTATFIVQGDALYAILSCLSEPRSRSVDYATVFSSWITCLQASIYDYRNKVSMPLELDLVDNAVRMMKTNPQDIHVFLDAMIGTASEVLDEMYFYTTKIKV